MTSYSERLRDPRWQKKRLEIMNRDNFTCRGCKATDRTLNVHHCFYAKGRDPWDYPDGSLVTLCEPCHEYETEHGYAAKQNLLAAIVERGVMSHWLDAMATALRNEHVYDAITLVVCWHQVGLDSRALADQICHTYSSAVKARSNEAPHG